MVEDDFGINSCKKPSFLLSSHARETQKQHERTYNQYVSPYTNNTQNRGREAPTKMIPDGVNL